MLSLPKIDMPIFEIVLPSTGEKIMARPFTVKEEKILLIARETKDLDQIMLATKQVINNCLINKKIEDLAMVDMEYVLLSIRSQSVDNNIKFTIVDPETQEPVQLEINLGDITLHREEEHTNKIKINDQYTLIMKYPTIDEAWIILKMSQEKTSTINAEFDVMINCLDKLVNADEVFKFNQIPKNEITEFVESLDRKTINKIKNFFKTMPKLRHTIEYTNSLGNKKTFVLQGLETFFM